MVASSFRAFGSLRAAAAGALLLAAAACSTGRAELPGGSSAMACGRDLTVRRGRFEDRFLLTGQLVGVSASEGTRLGR